ncbi:PAS domain S-box protein [Candidatus Neomarinimicrobiota bacterium]
MNGRSTSPLSQFEINWFTLTFPQPLEKEFHQTHFEKSLRQVRIALLLGIFFYSVFAGLDILIFPEVRQQLWLIRFAIVVPFIIAIYLLSYSKLYIKLINVSTAAVVLMAGLGIIAMILIAPAPANALYYAGLLLVLFYGYTFFKLRFIWAMLAGWLIVAGYEIAAILMIETPTDLLLSNSYFFLAGNLIGMFASYSIEVISRRDFIQAYLLETEKEKVDTLNRDLEARVEERTRQVVKANIDLRQEMEERKEAEEKYAQLFEDSKDAVFITTPRGTFLDLNPAGIDLFGYESKEEILETEIARDIYLNPSDRQEFQDLITKQGHVIDFEIRCKRKNGQPIIVQETATAIRDKNGNIVAYQGIIRDITERKELERQLFQAQKMESIGMIAGGIAHDLNNVLTPITISIQLLRDKLTDQRRQQILDTLESNANRGADIVKQVLTFARGAEAEFTTVHPKKLIEEIANIVDHTFPKGIKVSSQLEEGVEYIQGNLTQLHQVLLNLCLNSRDAMPSGGELTLHADMKEVSFQQARLYPWIKPGVFARISVSDTGEGMSPQVQEKIFEPFFTTKKVGQGTGLGLSVVHSIIQSHHGFVEVESKTGTGSTINVYLPVDAAILSRSERTPEVEVLRGHGELVLVTDDEESIRMLTREILESHNYKVLTAMDGTEALQLFKDHRDEIKVILTDMIMPEMDGVATIQSIRSLDETVPIIATSGLATEEPLLDDSIKSKIQASVPKPFTGPDLLRVISRLLEE